MSVLSTIIGIIVGGMVLASVGKVYLGIYQTIKQQNLAANKYKVSFKKHFKKIKVPLIKMKVGEELHYFLVDSGATDNVISKSFFDTIDHKCFNDLHYAKPIVSANGTTKECPYMETTLSFKRDYFEDIPFLITDIKDAVDFIKEKSNITIVGILGSTFFDKYRWAIDFDERCIWINPLETTQKDE